MDWAAKLLGLSPAFLNTSGIGGGIIMVVPLLPITLWRLANACPLDNSF